MTSINNIKASDGTGPAAKATLTSPRAVTATTFTVDTVAHWPANFIATTGTVDPTSGLITSATLQVFFGHLSGTNIVIDSFAPGYTDKGNSSGDIVVIKPTTAWTKELVGILSASLNDDGTIQSSVISSITSSVLNSGSTATNLRVKPRASATTSTSTLSPNIDNYNIYDLTAQTAALTIANPTGTPYNGDVIIIRIKDDGTSRAVTYGTSYANVSGLSDLTATTAGKWHHLGIVYNSTAAKWHIASITAEA